MSYRFVNVALTFLLMKITYEITAAQSLPADSIVCGNITCANKAKCKQTSNGKHFCLCHVGFKGKTCEEDIEECKYGYPCYHRGHCHNSFGSYRCECLDGWFGEDVHCNIKDNFTTDRKCIPGWMGEWCQDQCLDDSMCRETEICRKRGRGLRCLCAPGWHGGNCSIDIDECSRHPCPDNRVCTNTQGSYKCQCQSGWTGSNCDEDINECLTNPCKHLSMCLNGPGYYNCSCEHGWEGENCDRDIDECVNNPCNDSLQCNNTPGLFSCTDIHKQEKRSEKRTTVIVGSVVGAIMFLVCIGVLVIIKKYKCKSIKRNVVNNEEQPKTIQPQPATEC